MSTDPTRKKNWLVDQHTKCYACADRETLMRDARERYKNEKPRPETHMYMDGRDFRVVPSGLYLPATALKGVTDG